MGPSRRARTVAWSLVAIALVAAAPVRAQLYDDARRALDLSPDPLARSPRLVGMGGLTLVFDDVHSRVDLWEYAHNPAGLLDTDTTSTLEFIPGTAARSMVHDEESLSGVRERQDFALRQVSLSYEAFRRASRQTTFGFIGDLGHLRSDAPLTLSTERRSQFTVPNTLVALSGRVASFYPDRLRYGLDVRHRYESSRDIPRGFVSNAEGDYIDKDGVTLTSADPLTPDEHGVRSMGGGLGLSFDVAPWLSLAGGYDFLSSIIEGKNNAVRSTSEIHEERGFGNLSAAALGHVGHARYIAAIDSWSTGPSDQQWFFTISRGTGQSPLQGRGNYQKRDEKGSELRGRATWTEGPLTFAAGARRYRRNVDFTAPSIDDPNSFNRFLQLLATRGEVDSLLLPDSVRTNATLERALEVGGGVGVRLPWRGAQLGVEVHANHGTFEQTLAGDGPKPKGWDVRAGGSVNANSTLSFTGGYVYRRDDADELTLNNETLSQSATAGFGLHPPTTVWSIETGYELRWAKSDYGDPTRRRSTGQRGSMRVRWEF
jgi:hypothetical protein